MKNPGMIRDFIDRLHQAKPDALFCGCRIPRATAYQQLFQATIQIKNEKRPEFNLSSGLFYF